MDGFQVALKALFIVCGVATAVVCFPIFIWFFALFGAILSVFLP